MDRPVHLGISKPFAPLGMVSSNRDSRDEPHAEDQGALGWRERRVARKSGTEFEEKFAGYMKRACGVTRTELRTHVKGKVANRGHECDIHGVIEQQLWRRVRWSALLAAIATAAVLILPDHARPGESADIAAVGERGGSELSPVARVIGLPGWQVGLLALSLGAAVLARIALWQTTRHIWVECQDRKTSIKRTDINKLVNSAADAAALDDAKWTANELWFASSSKYDGDAKNTARENTVRCFQTDARGAFVEIDVEDGAGR